MKKYDQRKSLIETRRHQRTNLRRVLAILGCMVVFVTAFALMVPAISITQDAADKESGFYRDGGQSTVVGTAGADGADQKDSTASEQANSESGSSGEATTGFESIDDAGVNGSAGAPGEQNADSENENNTDEPDAAVEAPESDDNDENEAEKEDASEEKDSSEVAQSFTGELKDAYGRTLVGVEVEAPEGALPEGTTMRVSQVTNDKVIGAAQKKGADELKGAAMVSGKTAQEADDDVRQAKTIPVSVTFIDKAGKEIKPSQDVHMTITTPAVGAIDNEDKIAVVNLDSATVKKAGGIDSNDKGGAAGSVDSAIEKAAVKAFAERVNDSVGVVPSNELDVNRDSQTVSFDAADSQVFAVVYTVDFHYEVDGKVFDYSISGGSYAALSDLIKLFGVAVESNTVVDSDVIDDVNAGVAVDMNDNPEEDSEASLRQFMRNVANVKFSNPELMSVSFVGEDRTVGAIKAALGLECDYSAEITPEKISEIETTAVKAGDWALIGLKPFVTDETLTITMNDGEVFVVNVTDAQIKKTVIDAKGDTWEITVTYGEDAQIPDDARLEVEELTEGNAKYEEFRADIAANMTESAEKIPDHPILFDISIWSGSQEIEPAEGSNVQVEVKLIRSAIKGMLTDDEAPLLINNSPVPEEKGRIDQSIQIIHQVEEGVLEFVETTNMISGEEIVSQFVTDSFSNWLLYLDEKFEDNEITVYKGDSITLRPYGEWYWKKNDEPEPLSTWDWTFPTSEYNVTEGDQTVLTNYSGATETYHGITQAVTKDGEYTFTGKARYDRELKEYYWFYDATLNEIGEFDLHIGTSSGDVRTIKVNVVPKPASDTGKPETVQGTPNIKVNLFDYDNGGKLDEGWEWGHYEYYSGSRVWVPGYVNGAVYENNHNLSNNVFNNTVNVGHSLKFLSSGSGGSDGLNGYTNQYPHQGLVENTMPTTGSNAGFPELKDSYGGDSLKYLFDTTDTVWGSDNAVIAYPDVSGLFQFDEENGYYYYNSNMNYAYYDSTNNQMKLYEHTYTQNTEGSGGVNGKPIGFFPFHDYDSTDDLSVNQNSELNHHFGMSMQVEFTLPYNKLNKENHITYEFSGDDDLWVYVDNQLVLDIGGIHQPVRGYIDFTDGNVYVYGVNSSQPQVIQFVKDLASDTKHTLDMFYVERGGCDSNLSVKFNLPLVLGEVNFTKNGEVLNADGSVGSHALPGAGFSLYDNEECNGTPIYTATAGADGVVHFDNISLGTYFMKETTVPEGYSENLTLYKVEVLKDITNVTELNKVYAQTGDGQWTEITKILNTKEKTAITVSKNWINAGNTEWPESIKAVQIGLYYSVDGGNPVELSAKKCTLDAEHTSYTFNDLLTTDDNNKVISYSVKEESITLSDDTVNSPENAGIGVSISGISNGAVTVTNTLKPDLSLVKVDKNNHSVELSGAEFVIQKKNADGSTWSNVTDNTSIKKQDGTDADYSQQGNFIIPQDGVVLTDLDNGDYQIIEMVPPKGYIIANNPVLSFKVENGLIKINNQTITSYEIENTPGEALPNAGASGTMTFTILGSILIAGAVTLMLRRWRRA